MNNNEEEKRYYRNRQNTKFVILWGDKMVCQMNNTVSEESVENPGMGMAVGMSIYQATPAQWKEIQNEIGGSKLLVTNYAAAREFKLQLHKDMPKILQETGLLGYKLKPVKKEGAAV